MTTVTFTDAEGGEEYESTTDEEGSDNEVEISQDLAFPQPTSTGETRTSRTPTTTKKATKKETKTETKTKPKPRVSQVKWNSQSYDWTGKELSRAVIAKEFWREQRNIYQNPRKSSSISSSSVFLEDLMKAFTVASWFMDPPNKSRAYDEFFATYTSFTADVLTIPIESSNFSTTVQAAISFNVGYYFNKILFELTQKLGLRGLETYKIFLLRATNNLGENIFHTLAKCFNHPSIYVRIDAVTLLRTMQSSPIWFASHSCQSSFSSYPSTEGLLSLITQAKQSQKQQISPQIPQQIPQQALSSSELLTEILGTKELGKSPSLSSSSFSALQFELKAAFEKRDLSGRRPQDLVENIYLRTQSFVLYETKAPILRPQNSLFWSPSLQTS